MKTFQEIFCDRHRCEQDGFRRSVFWRSLHRHALPVAPLLGGYGSRYFAPERELISGVAQARNMAAVREELLDYFMSFDSRSLLRRWLRIRISTHRLKKLAREYLPAAEPSSSP